nr:MAG TPA: hypothetical protein [Caudoviricetes sp.]
MSIDESSEKYKTNTPNMRDIFANPKVGDGIKENTEAEKPNLDDTQDKITAFLEFLNEKYKTKEEIQEYLDFHIKCLYENDEFRHSYFNISAYLQAHRPEIKGEELQEKKPINENLRILKDEIIIEEKYSAIRRKLFKFIDHCNLELSRFAYFETVYWRSEAAKDEFSKIKDDYEQLNKKREDIDKSMSELKQELSSSKSEYITILGIFAAIMLAGLGSFAALGGALSNINSISLYKFFACTAFIGLILFNVVTALIYMITRIIGRNIYTACTDSHDGDCVNGSCDKVCNPISRIRKRLPYIYWFNVIDIAVIVCSLATEYLVLKYSVADWIIIFLAFIIVGNAIAFGLKNIIERS